MKSNTTFKHIAIGILLAITSQSCTDILDTKPFDKIGEDVVWSNRANAETYLFSTYSILNNFAGGAGTDAWTLNIIAMDGTYNGASGVFNERLDRNSDMGFNNWAAIRRCNLVIEKMHGSSTISELDKKELIAEAKFLRAMSYFNTARRIGRIVWIDKVLTPNDELLLPATASAGESYSYIIKDLEEAVLDLPKSKVSGRANKYVAAAMLTEVCLQAIAYENYPQALSVIASNPLLQKVIQYGEIVKEGGYSLESDYGGIFNEGKPNSSETIFGIYRKV